MRVEPFMIGRREQAAKGSKSRANKTGNYALFVMAQQKLKSTGPMGMQPSYHGSTMPFPLQPAPLKPAMPALAGADAPAADAGGTAPAKTKLTRPQAVRIAKARIMRRNSLRKQRLALKG
jgi:hypothetical protein